MCRRDRDEDYHREISEEISTHLRKLIDLKKEKSVLVVGLGNAAITADALGPQVVDNLLMTRHIIKEYGLSLIHIFWIPAMQRKSRFPLTAVWTVISRKVCRYTNFMKKMKI